MAIRKRKPTSAGRRFQTVGDFAEITTDRPLKALTKPKNRTGGRNSYGRMTTAPQGRRSQAQVPRDRLPPEQGRRARERRDHRVRPEPHRTYRAAPLRRWREALHRGARRSQGRRHAPERAWRRDPGRQRSAAALHPGRHHGAQRRDDRAPAPSSAAAPAPPSSSSRRRASTRPCVCLPRRCAAFRSIAGATIGEVGNSEHGLVSLGKAGRNRWKGNRPHTRGVAMNPVDHPLGGGEGKSSGGRHPVSPWGKKEGRTRRKAKASDSMIVRRRRTRGARR